jgi:Glutamine synthetase, catalytic domain
MVCRSAPPMLPASIHALCHQTKLSNFTHGWNPVMLPSASCLAVLDLQEAGEHFIAGVLEHLPGIAAFLAASPNSYRRIQLSAWAGAYQVGGVTNGAKWPMLAPVMQSVPTPLSKQRYHAEDNVTVPQVWGLNNREATLRFIQDTGGRANCEIKVGLQLNAGLARHMQNSPPLKRSSKAMGLGALSLLVCSPLAPLQCTDDGRHSQPASGNRGCCDCWAAGPSARQQAASALPRRPRSIVTG